MGDHNETIYRLFFPVQNLLGIRIILIKIESELTYPNYSESCPNTVEIRDVTE